MGDSDAIRAEDECERLRGALEAETCRRLELERQLARANSEFEEFVSMAAHNLRESLRDVAAFSQLVAETSCGLLDSEAAASLDRVREGAARAQALLADVVEYWSAATDEGKLCRTEMEAAVSQALLALEREIGARGAIVTHDPLPPVTGDFAALSKVLEHLVRNAITYCDAAPQVHVSFRQADLELVFSVRDNGPGVEVALQGRLFKAFKRLHGKEHAGNGLGLAFCRKVIERHGGRVWIESTPGAGSTFYFTLPAAE